MKRKIKIILTCALCLILAAGMLAGCGSKDTAKGGEEVTLNYVAHGPEIGRASCRERVCQYV
jgi:ABC-type oligopeptide transport system substrate-binding subunit